MKIEADLLMINGWPQPTPKNNKSLILKELKLSNRVNYVWSSCI